MNGYYSKQPRFWRGLSIVIGLSGVLLWPSAARAQDATRASAQPGKIAKQRADKQQENAGPESRPANEPVDRPTSRPTSREEQPLSWARIDFILNRVNLVPRRSNARRARISDVLGIGDALQTFESSNAELRFNDGSEVRIGSQATFRFTPNTRNFELTNGTVLLLIPPERGRTTIQTPNAVTGIQGSALFVRYIKETDTTIVGALTDNPDGPMILYTNNGTEEQALYANQVGVVEGDRITELYEIDSRAFWESSGLAETFDYTQNVGPVVDELDGVRQEIREAIDNQVPIDGSNVVENPDNFSRPETAAPPEVAEPTDNTVEAPSEPNSGSETGGSGNGENGGATVENPNLTVGGEDAGKIEEGGIRYEGSPAEEFHNQGGEPAAPGSIGTNSLQPAALTEAESGGKKPAVSTGTSDRPNANANQPGTGANPPNGNNPAASGGSRPGSDRPTNNSSPATPIAPATPAPTRVQDDLIDNPVLPNIPGRGDTEIVIPPPIGAVNDPASPPTAQTSPPTGGVIPPQSGALQDADPGKKPNSGAETAPNSGAETALPAKPPEGSLEPLIIENTNAAPSGPEEVEAVDPSTAPAPLPEDKPNEVAPPTSPIEETNTTPSNSGGADAVVPPTGLDREPIEVAPIIEGTDATLNNPGEAEAVVIPPSPGLSGVDVLEELPLEPTSGAAPSDFLAEDVLLIEEVPLVEILEGPIPVQLEETVPFAVEQINDLPAGQVQLGGMGNEPMNSTNSNNGVVDGATLTNTSGGAVR